MPDDARLPEIPDPQADAPALRAFVAVARHGTVGRAAERLGRTQPSISARLAALEEAWKTRLFRRVSRGMVLTPEGARLLPLAEASLAALEDLDRAAGLPPAGSRALRVGAGDALGRELLPRALGRLLTRAPEVEVYLREGPGARLIEALREGEIDLALVLADAARAAKDVDVEPWIRSDIQLLVPGRVAGAAERAVRVEALAGQRLVVLQRGSGFRRHLEAAFAQRGVPFRPAIEVGNLSLVRRFVAAGLGSAPVPAIAFDADEMHGVIRKRVTGIPALSYCRAVRRGTPLSPVARDMLALMTPETPEK